MTKLTLTDHPRLYIPAEVVAHTTEHLHSPHLQRSAEAVLRDADWLVRLSPMREDEVEYGYQPVTRPVNTYLRCLTTAWLLTREDRYRKAAMKHLAGLLEFTHISCEARFNSTPDQEFFYCLSYGELSSTLAVMYDVLGSEITADEKALIHSFLDKHLMKEALKCLERPPWWANQAWSNWNGVCAGGMGMMALAFYDDYPEEAEALLPFVETSLDPYFQSYVANGGGCPEGTGYYNYAMNYAVRYLLSWENATGKNHPALQIKELGKSLHFPMDFTKLNFGDNDGWNPAPWFFLLAERMQNDSAAMNAATYINGGEAKITDKKARRKRGDRANPGGLIYAASAIPKAKDIERMRAAKTKTSVPVARVYNGMGWAALADDETFPSLRMTVRGGITAVAGHAMKDQLSFKCRVNGETMITDQADRPKVSFTKRGNDVFGRSAASKSGLFIDGLGSDLNAETDTTQVVKGDGLLGIRVEGAQSFLPRWEKAFVGRLFLLVDKRYWLVIDRAVWSNPANQYGFESRFQTFAESKSGRDWVRLKRGKERLTMTFAALDPARLQEARGLPTYPVEPTTIFRWMSAEQRNDHLQVTALHPSNGKLKLALRREPRNAFVITVTEPDGQQREVRVNSEIMLQ